MKNLLRSLRDLFLKPAVRSGLRVLVTGGLQAGDRVVVQGASLIAQIR